MEAIIEAAESLGTATGTRWSCICNKSSAHEFAGKLNGNLKKLEGVIQASFGMASETRQGSPAACASHTTRPSPSYRDGKTKQSIAPFIRRGTSLRLPVKTK